jgi:hypothetical protein
VSGNLERLRICVGEMPRLLRDIVEDILRAQPDMEIVRLAWSDHVAAVLERRHADVVIVQDSSTDQVAAERLVIVAYTERDTGAFSFRPLPIAELSPQALVQAIREARLRSASTGHE